MAKATGHIIGKEEYIEVATQADLADWVTTYEMDIL